MIIKKEKFSSFQVFINQIGSDQLAARFPIIENKITPYTCVSHNFLIRRLLRPASSRMNRFLYHPVVLSTRGVWQSRRGVARRTLRLR